MKEDTRARLIAVGAQLVHEKGFNHTGVQEILQASGVPKGSFYFYFQSKEEFGMAVVDFFSQFITARMDAHLSDGSLAYVARLKGFFDEMKEYFRVEGYAHGCPIGNLAQELADLSDTFREKLRQALATMEAKFAACLQGAVEANEIARDMDPVEAANFILNSWEGALMRMKAEKSLEPLLVFDKMVFGLLLSTRVH